MDDVEIVSNPSLSKEMVSFDIRMVHKINDMHVSKILERKYVNRLYGNVYVTGIDNVSISNKFYQHPNDTTYIVDTRYSIVGITYFKNMQLAFVLENMININSQTFFKKKNVVAIINKINIQDKQVNGMDNPIIVVRVIYDPNYVTEGNVVKVGLVCDLDRLIEQTEENKRGFNIII